MSDNMTPIIEELAREVEACYIPRYDMWQMDSETLKKFAESIIQECMACSTWVGKMNTNSVEPVHTAHAINQRIKQQFGVEE